MPTSRCVFVSHADEDKDVALVLKSLILKGAGKPMRVFVSSDLKDKRHGTDWMKRIGTELADTSAFVFLASPSSLKASWTNIEIGGALFSKPQPRIFPICIAGLTIPQLPSPSNRFDASHPGSADELRDVVESIVRASKVPFSKASTVDWEAAYLAFCEAQEEWLTIDHEVFSACSPETLRYLEPILNVARSGQDAAGLYSDLIGHVLQTMTFHGSPIDDRFWVDHGNRRWAIWREASNATRNWSPSSPIASGSSASRSNRAAGLALNSPSAMASTSVEAGESKFDSSYFPPALRHSTATLKTLLRARNGLSCLVSDAVRNSEHEAARPCANQTVSSA
jgi:hypothetical protein